MSNALDGYLLFKLVDNVIDVISIYILDLNVRIEFNEVFYVQESTTDPHINLITFFYLNVHPTLSKLIDTLWLPQEENFHIFTLRVLVDELRQSQVNMVELVRNVKTQTLF